jgi:hypothetical protein
VAPSGNPSGGAALRYAKGRVQAKDAADQPPPIEIKPDERRYFDMSCA